MREPSYRWLEYAKSAAKREDVSELEARAEMLEKELARNVAGHGEAIQQVHWQGVQKQLRPDEITIEFIHFKLHKPDPD